MEREYDAVIVGARVAGSATALCLARLGHRVLVVDRAPRIGDTLSTHAVLRTGVVQLTRWGLLDRVIAGGAPPSRRMVLSVDGATMPLPADETGRVAALYAPRRHVLDNIVLDAARRAGADVALGTSLTGVVHDATGRVAGARLRSTAGERIVRACFTVGADGLRSRVAAAVGAPVLDHRPATCAWIYTYVAGVGTGDLEMFYGSRRIAGIFPTNDGLANVYVGVPVTEADRVRTDPDGLFHETLATISPSLAERIRAGARVERFRVSTGLPALVRRPHGPGWALVGDAGHHKDAASGHGISSAFRDAELLARSLHASARGDEPERAALAGFEARRDALSHRMHEAVCGLASLDWDGPGAIAHLATMGEAIDRECDVLWALDTAGDTAPVAA
ncbi:MAG: FAD-dependent monooxygenase [Acidimicrobiia bacterium]|nr:FAD-dependent monooxygenase [Acidimicrobiia bacterium]